MNSYVIGIDLGGTKICGALADLDGNILIKKTIATEANSGEEHILNRIISVIEDLKIEGKVEEGQLKSIGIGSPGPLDSVKGTIIEASNLPFKNFNLVNPISEKFNVPAYLQNDANVAALGEHLLGAGKGTNNMVYITVSTGIGGGAIINGKLYSGNTCNALEIGHTTIVPDGPRCNCGNYGCIEAVASGTAIAKRAKEAIKRGEKTSLSSYENVTSFEVFKEEKNGDKVAKSILDEALNYLGIGIANVVNIFDPEMIVIGGGVSKGGDIVFDTVKKVVKERSLKAMGESCRIEPAKLGGDAGVSGAVALALSEIK